MYNSGTVIIPRIAISKRKTPNVAGLDFCPSALTDSIYLKASTMTIRIATIFIISQNLKPLIPPLNNFFKLSGNCSAVGILKPNRLASVTHNPLVKITASINLANTKDATKKITILINNPTKLNPNVEMLIDFATPKPCSAINEAGLAFATARVSNFATCEDTAPNCLAIYQHHQNHLTLL